MDGGYAALAFVGGDESNEQSMMRSRFFEESAAACGVERALCFSSDFSESEGKVITRRMLRSVPHPIGVVYENNSLALGGLAAAAEEGVKVPHQMGIVTWEDSALCRVTEPTLSAVVRLPEVIGEEGAKIMARLLRENATEATSIRVGHLQVRASSRRSVPSPLA